MSQDFKAMQAGLRHLIDLKRAGHSPKRTELQVDPRTDRILTQPRVRQLGRSDTDLKQMTAAVAPKLRSPILARKRGP